MLSVLEGARLPTLQAPRVVLRWLTESDVPALFAIFSDPAVMRYWPYPALGTVADARALLGGIQEGFRERRLFQWGVARRDDDRVIGTCTLHQLEPTHRRAEIGYALGRAHWGQGYMREALSALLSFSFEVLRLHRLEADVDPRNAPSLRSLEALGFQKEGVLRERWHCQGEIQDAAVFALLRSEWEVGRRGPEAEAPIETERLLLRRPRAADAEAIFARYASDPEVTRYLGWPTHRSVADTLSFIAASDADWAQWSCGPYLVFERESGRLLGGTGLQPETPGRALTGYVLAGDAWGRGLATEALAAMVALAAARGVRRLYALCYPAHVASVRVLEKGGFALEGTWRQHSILPNLDPQEPQDVSVFVRLFPRR